MWSLITRSLKAAVIPSESFLEHQTSACAEPGRQRCFYQWIECDYVSIRWDTRSLALCSRDLLRWCRVYLEFISMIALPRGRDRVWERGMSLTEMDEHRDQVRRSEWGKCLVAHVVKRLVKVRYRSSLVTQPAMIILKKNSFCKAREKRRDRCSSEIIKEETGFIPILHFDEPNSFATQMYREHSMSFFLFADSPRSYHLLHFLSWIMAITGMFFILAGHQHYSIDILVAWVLTSRLFIYYHTYDPILGTRTNETNCHRFPSSLANNRTYLQRDKNRMRIWFPFFSYFEENVKQAIPNEYCLPDIVHSTCTKLHSCLDQMRYPTDWFLMTFLRWSSPVVFRWPKQIQFSLVVSSFRRNTEVFFFFFFSSCCCYVIA